MYVMPETSDTIGHCAADDGWFVLAKGRWFRLDPTQADVRAAIDRRDAAATRAVLRRPDGYYMHAGIGHARILAPTAASAPLTGGDLVERAATAEDIDIVLRATMPDDS